MAIDAGSGVERTAFEVSEVKFKELDDEEIKLYVESGEPLDKAGAYGIQGLASFFVEWIHGDFYNVVGLPLKKIRDLLLEFGFDILREVVKKKNE